MRTLLNCDGMRVANSLIPPFIVSTGEHVGVAIPADYGIDANVLMQSFAGLQPTSDIQVVARTPIVIPRGCQYDGLDHLRTLDALLERGVSRAIAEQALTALDLQPNDVYGSLQLTPRMILDMRVARDQGSELVVFSSGGLDPLGISAVMAEATQLLSQGALVHLVSAALIQRNESEIAFSKLVRCEFIEQKSTGCSGAVKN